MRPNNNQVVAFGPSMYILNREEKEKARELNGAKFDMGPAALYSTLANSLMLQPAGHSCRAHCSKVHFDRQAPFLHGTHSLTLWVRCLNG
jgi:hypothetical protein